MIDFDQFWQAYPKKVAKKPAEKAWNRISHHRQHIALRDIELGRYNGTEKPYIPNAATYLNQERWEDEIIEQPKQKEEWEVMPRDDDKLIPWARRWKFPEPREGENYYQYRQKLGQKIQERRDERD
jgi:hypothetical protein